MALRTYSFRPEYRSGYNDLIGEFYHPALGRASDYWRAAGFFSSTAFEAIGDPMGQFLESGGRMRLVTSVHLTHEDVDAIRAGLRREEAVERRLLEQLREDFANPLGRGARILCGLLASGRLEMRVALPSAGSGMYHEKLGLFLDGVGDFVTFSGSPNESRAAFEENYEAVDVFTSWDDAHRAQSKRRYFEELWSGEAIGVETLDFPEAARRELIRLQGREGSSTPRSGTTSQDAWRHQSEAIQVFLSSRRGILEMATGTGKTWTTLEILRRLTATEAVHTVIISADGTDLLDQWYRQLVQVARSLPRRFSVVRHYAEHHDRDRYLLSPTRTILLVSRENLPPALTRLPGALAERCLLVHDEVHRLGSPGNRIALEGLSERITYRLGLSATPDREYDREGNEFIEGHVGPVIFRFGLDDAIRRGILSPFNYYPLPYIPDANDRERIQQVFKKQAARKESGRPMRQEELWTELARVHKTSLAKLPPFESFIAERQDLLRRCIVFVETREYGERVLPIIHQHRYDFHTYYAEDDRETLQAFARGDIQCLLTCHRVSEGIDIRSLQNVILFASARARLETVQRMGRCLRSDPTQPLKRANVVDFIRQTTQGLNDENADSDRCAWLQALASVEPEEIPA